MSSKQDLILEVENLSVGFGKSGKCVEVTSDVSFSLRKGQILSLVGESGCGKSLSCLALTRLLPPMGRIIRGSVRYYHKDGNVYDFAFGLNWSGVINDWRVKKYK